MLACCNLTDAKEGEEHECKHCLVHCSVEGDENCCVTGRNECFEDWNGDWVPIVRLRPELGVCLKCALNPNVFCGVWLQEECVVVRYC